jgi:hypothetical protein
MIDERYTRFLIDQAHADAIRHSGRTLFEHLCGTHDLLREWGNDKPVCNAGLFHSIYGTKHFRTQAWPLTDRDTIRELIGPHAEMLAHAFCTLDRPRAFFEANFDGDNELVSALREIETANLLEQGSKSRWLSKLHESDISASAKLAIVERAQAVKTASPTPEEAA